MLQRLYETTLSTGTIASANYTSAIDMNKVATLSIQAVVDVTISVAKAFPSSDVNTTTNAITEVAHGFVTGLKGQFTTDGVLPTGISASTDYFIIYVTADTFKVATSLANALAGTAVDITAQGSGNDTFTPTALAGGTLSFQKTNKGIASGDGASTTAADWIDIDTATAITVDGTTWFEVVGPSYRWFRIKADMTAGSMSNTYYILTRGDDS